MRLIFEGLLIVGGALAIFRYAYHSWLGIRRRERDERHAEDEWLDDQLRADQLRKNRDR